MSVKLYAGDCLEVMASLPEASVDAVIADPPYQQTRMKWDRWVKGWPEAVARILKPTGSLWVFGTLRMFLDRRDDFEGWRMAQDIVWEKHNGSSLRNDRFRRVHEQAVQFYRGEWAPIYKGRVVTYDAKKRSIKRTTTPAHFYASAPSTFESADGGPRLQRSVIFARSEHGRAIHPTQKPEAIIEPLILNACPPGGVVLDPFAGSGSTGAAALNLGRSAILIERDPKYVEVIRERLQITQCLTA